MDAVYCYFLLKRLVGKDDLEHHGKDIGIFREESFLRNYVENEAWIFMDFSLDYLNYVK